MSEHHAQLASHRRATAGTGEEEAPLVLIVEDGLTKLLLYDTDIHGAEVVVDKLGAALGLGATSPASQWTAAASVGIAMQQPNSEIDPTTLLQQADEKMYVAKHRRRSGSARLEVQTQ